MRFGLASTLPGAVTSPAGIASSFIGSTRICASLGESGGMMTLRPAWPARRQRREPIEVLSALPPQPAPASAQANTNKKLIGGVLMMIRKFPGQYRYGSERHSNKLLATARDDGKGSTVSPVREV